MPNRTINLQKNIIFLFLLISSISNSQNINYKQLGAGGGGQMLTYFCDDDNPQKLYVGSDVAGVWLSENGGDNYKYITRAWKAEYVQCIKKHPTQEKIYVGCNQGIFSTSDDGENWQLVLQAGFISEFYIFEENGNEVIYAITGRTRIPDQGQDVLGDNQFYRCNFNGSGTTESYAISQEIEGNSFALNVNPINSEQIWITSNHGVFYSSNAGATFENKSGDLPAGNITSMISNPDNFEEKIVTNYTEGVFKRIGGFDIWTNITGNLVDKDQYSCVIVDPSEAEWGQKLFAVQADGNLEGGLWYSQNGGGNWVKRVSLDNSLMGWAANNKIASHAKGVFINGANELFMGRSGNIFKCTNPNQNDFNWEQIYTNDLGAGQYTNRGLVNTVARDIVADPENPNELWIAEGDRLLWKSENGGDSFSKVSNFNLTTDITLQHGYFVVFNPVNPDIMLAGLAQASPGGVIISALFKSLNGGESWNQIYTWENSEFVKLAYSSDGTEIYLGLKGEVNGVYKSNTGGNAWQLVGWDTNKVYDLNTHPTDNNILFVGIGDLGPPTRGLHRGERSGGSWEFTRVLTSGLNWDVQYDPFNSSIIYAAMGIGGLHKSTDNGLTWTQILSAAGGTGCRAIAIDKSNGDLYAASDGDEIGVLGGIGTAYIKKSTDKGITWTDITQDFPNMPIWSMKHVESANGDFLLLSTKGLGTFKVLLEYEATNILSENNIANKLEIYPNPAHDHFSIKLDNTAMRYYTFSIYDMTGKKLDEKELDNSYISYSTNQLKAGIYFVEILYDGNKFSQKLIVN
jgi:Secretion system C-terminal sorting domain